MKKNQRKNRKLKKEKKKKQGVLLFGWCDTWQARHATSYVT